MDPRAFDALDPEVHLAEAALKQRYVKAMFEIIAPRYDQFTRWFSLGMDAGWKRSLLSQAAARCGQARVAVDLACGTGDLSFGVAASAPTAHVVGLDISRQMLRLAAMRAGAARARQQRAAERIAWCAADLCRLPLPNASADLVTAGYAVRNAASWTRALDEIARVLRPGGVLLSLDFFKPHNPLWRRLFLTYLSAAGRAYGWAWHRAPRLYGYIAASITRFTTAEAFADALAERGLRVERIDRRLGGGIVLHVARKDTDR